MKIKGRINRPNKIREQKHFCVMQIEFGFPREGLWNKLLFSTDFQRILLKSIHECDYYIIINSSDEIDYARHKYIIVVH